MMVVEKEDVCLFKMCMRVSGKQRSRGSVSRRMSLSNYYIILLSVLSLYIRYRKWDCKIQVAEDDILTRLLTSNTF